MWLKALAVRLAPERIGVFEVRPGIIRTDMTAAVAARYDALHRGRPRARAPLGRSGGRGAGRSSRWRVRSLAFATGSIINVDGALAVPRF